MAFHLGEEKKALYSIKEKSDILNKVESSAFRTYIRTSYQLKGRNTGNR